MSTQDYFISTDQQLVNVDFVHKSLTQETYWGKTFTQGEIEGALKQSLFFGAYLRDGTQIGFSRVITDYMTLAYITDTFVHKDYRGRGIGRALITHVCNHKKLQKVRRWLLVTTDLQPFLRKHGFSDLENPSIYMEKLG